MDLFYILKWFLTIFITGTIFLPLTFVLFKNFKDKGYIFSKIISLALISYSVYLLGILHLAKFNEITIFAVIVISLLVNILIYRRNPILKIFKEKLLIIVIEELLFLAGLTFWAFVRAHEPSIHGLEKFMDFGFINSILRSDYFPPRDMWYTPFPINYYYFGHLITAVYTKLSNIPSNITFNLMVATIFSFTFSGVFSLAINLFKPEKIFRSSILTGLISGFLVTFGGNLTTIYSFFKSYGETPVPFWQLPFLPFSFPNAWWYPNATRFIPYTIHEFPLYSFVVSDLHGHVLDIPFVLLTLALSYSLILGKEIKTYVLLVLGFFLSVMYMTNAWDGLIYLLLIAIILLIKSTTRVKKLIFNWKNFIAQISIIVISYFIFLLPFNINFKPFVSGIGVVCAPTFLTNIGKIGPFLFEANHCQRSPIWQLFLLYGFFYFAVLTFLLFLRSRKKYQLESGDIFILILMFLSTILIIVPEFVYIKDIYPMHYRANTMFKLVYQAFIMLALSSGYVLVKTIPNVKNIFIKVVYIFLTCFLLFFVAIYPTFGINSYYGNLLTYHNLDGTLYLKPLYPSDYNAILWLNKNIKGQPVILEAQGDSYTDYARVSANTGLPTILGWTVHEWLWRGTYEIVAPRIGEVTSLYESDNLETTTQLIKKYNIKLVFIGDLERQKYPKLDEAKFKKLGKIIYQNGQTKIYQINS